jgi:Rrf2 family iron-sulfur cluster assembly transcriptional regulator
MILGTKARYAVMAMVDLAKNTSGKPITLAEIASRQEIPLPYLEQIFSKLKRQGLVKSVKGPGGGYLMAKECTDTWVADIVTAVDESLKMTRCEAEAHGGCMATRTKCLTHDLWDGLGRQIYAYLKSISLQDVCDRKVKSQQWDFIGHNDTHAVQPHK